MSILSDINDLREKGEKTGHRWEIQKEDPDGDPPMTLVILTDDFTLNEIIQLANQHACERVAIYTKHIYCEDLRIE